MKNKTEEFATALSIINANYIVSLPDIDQPEKVSIQLGKRVVGALYFTKKQALCLAFAPHEPKISAELAEASHQAGCQFMERSADEPVA